MCLKRGVPFLQVFQKDLQVLMRLDAPKINSHQSWWSIKLNWECKIKCLVVLWLDWRKNNEVYLNQNPSIKYLRKSYLTNTSHSWKNLIKQFGNALFCVNHSLLVDLQLTIFLKMRKEKELFGCGELEFERQELWQQSTKH